MQCAQHQHVVAKHITHVEQHHVVVKHIKHVETQHVVVQHLHIQVNLQVVQVVKDVVWEVPHH